MVRRSICLPTNSRTSTLLQLDACRDEIDSYATIRKTNQLNNELSVTSNPAELHLDWICGQPLAPVIFKPITMYLKFHARLQNSFVSLHAHTIITNMPSKLAKVQKHVTKKKGSKINSLHENSRDAQRLRGAGARDDRVARLHAVRKKANRQWVDRVTFVQNRLPETLHPMEIDAVQHLILAYLARHDEELEQLKAERRSGRPRSTRQTLLEQQRELEGKEYESGFWLPNLQDEGTLMKLDGWKGDWVGLGIMRFARVDNKGTVKESQFPPRGAS